MLYDTVNNVTKKMNENLTHAHANMLVGMYLAVFAPAFTFSLCESECSRKPPNAQSLGRYRQVWKKKKRQIYCIKTEKEMKSINPLSGTLGFSRHKNPRFEKPKEPSIFHTPKPTHHPLKAGWQLCDSFYLI